MYTPLYEFRKAAISKLEAVQEQVCAKHDRLIKSASKLREMKVAVIAQWNELCVHRHTLRKAKSKAPGGGKTKR